MIYIYESTETTFTHMGLGALSPSSCIVTEEINLDFSLEMRHPIDNDGKWERIERQRIVKVPTHRGDQLFRIYNVFKEPMFQKYVTVLARHIFYDLRDNFLENVCPTAKNGQDAGDAILDGCQTPTSFTFSSDITDISTAWYIRQNPVRAFIGPDESSFINRWGGEIERDNHDITINSRVGADNGVKIAYRKNLTGLEITVDDTRVVTRVMPTALDENGELFTTATKYYDSPLISNYPHPKYGVLDTGIRVGAEVNGSIPYPDDATALTAMEAMAEAYFDAGADRPQTTLNVNYIQLGKTDEYSQYANLFSVNIGDDVTVYYPPIDINLKLRVVIMKWDAILDQPYSATIGDLEPNIADTVVANDIDISAIKTNVEKALLEGETYYGVYVNHENGFVSQATIDGEEVTAKFNASELGFYDSSGNLIGGMSVVNSVLAMIAGVLANQADGNCYATIGSVDIEGLEYQGVFVYRKDYSTTNPVAKIVAYSNGATVLGTGGTFIIQNENEKTRMELNSNGGFWVCNENGNIRMSLGSDGAFSVFDNSYARIFFTENYSYIRAPGATNHGIGADPNGPYYVKNGSKTYF
jgi:phage minor structural protein